MNEKDAIDSIFDENNTDNVVLYNADDEAVEFEQIAIIPIEEKEYAILKPVVPLDGMNEDEALVFGLEYVDDEKQLVLVQDDKIVDKVFDVYEKLFDEVEE